MESLQGKRVFIAGHRGMIGSALVRRLATEQCDVLTAPRDVLDLLEPSAVKSYLAREKPDIVVVAAAKVGGILANDTRPAEFLFENLMIEANLIHGCHLADIQRLLFLGSSCIYPREAPQPIQEASLLTGPLEETNKWYAIAKISGVMLAQAYRRQYSRDYISAMPTNLYGPNDNFNLTSSHVLPALIRKAHDAKIAGVDAMEIWGSGTPMREFLHVDDCADALTFLLKNYSEEEHINVGSEEEISIFELAKLVARIIGFNGEVTRDISKPDGTPRKLMAADKLRQMGWRPEISLEEGVRTTYDWFLNNEFRG
jgi:GDP-L-fucose synthase